MDSDEKYRVHFTEECKKEINNIYWYISNILLAEQAAIRLVEEIESKVLILAELPQIYMKVNNIYGAKGEYGRIKVKNYIIIYLIDKQEETIYIVHIFYGRQNYFKFLD